MKEKDKQLYMDIAIRVAKQSYAKRLKVGAVFVTEDGILSIGYNGTPSGWANECEDKVWIDSQLTGNEIWDEEAQQYYRYVTKPEVLHAESNVWAKIKQAGISTKGGTLFITHSPCITCATEIYQSKVKSVYYGEVYRSKDGIDFLRKAGINVEQYNKK